MSWKEKMDDWGGGEISFLSEDGECILFIVVGDPVLIEGKFKGNTTERIGCPVITTEGFTLLIIGKRLARRLSKHEADFDSKAFVIVRRGEHDDIKTKYELTESLDVELTQKLLDFKKSDFDLAVVEEAVEYARQVATS